MDAIVLAGGFGTRLRPLVADVPKPMALIGGRPFLEVLLDSLARKGFKHVILSVGFMSEKIIGHFGDNFNGMKIQYALEDQPLGTGGGVRLAMDKLTTDHVFVINGDTFLDFEAEQLEQHWQMWKRPLIVGRHVPDTTRYGRLLTNQGVATGFSEKGFAGPGLINAGCYLLKQGQLDQYHLRQAFSLEMDFLALAVESGEFDVFETKGIFIDIGVPKDYMHAQKVLSEY